MKRRAVIVIATTGLLTVAGTSVAHAGGEGVSLSRDTSGCVVLLPDAGNPITVCLFPRP